MYYDMHYALDILKSKAYELEKSRDNLKASMERVELSLRSDKLSEETRKMLEEFKSGYDSSNNLLRDQIDSLYGAIMYLSRSETKERGDDI